MAYETRRKRMNSLPVFWIGVARIHTLGTATQRTPTANISLWWKGRNGSSFTSARLETRERRERTKIRERRKRSPRVNRKRRRMQMMQSQNIEELVGLS
jgi:hypothetical protein